MQRLAFPTFQIKAPQAAVISPWCKNCIVLPPNSPTDSTADSIYLGRIIAMPLSRACILQCLVANFENDTYSNLSPYTRLLKNNECRFQQSTAVATMQLQQDKGHSYIFCSRSACGSQIKRNNLNSCMLRWRSFETSGEPTRFRDWETHSFSAVSRSRMWLVKTQWTFQEYFQCSRFS